MLGPFGTGQRGNVFGGGGQRVRASGLSARINQLKNLLIGQAYARNRALLAQLVDVQQNRQHLDRLSCGVAIVFAVTGHHAQQRIAHGERSGKTGGHISGLAGRRQTALRGVVFNLGFHGGNRLTDLSRNIGVPTNVQRFGGVKDQLYIAGFGVVGHRVVGIVGGQQRIDDVLWTAGNLIGAFIDEFGIGHRDVFTGQHAGECARDANLQILRVLGVIVHLHGFGQRPQADQRRAGFGGLSYRRQCRDLCDCLTIEFNGHLCSFASTTRL